jgi:hypothetical protein
MKTFKTKITVKNIISTSITVLFTTLFVWWGMHFPGPIPPSAKADTFPVNCAIQASPTPTPITDGTQLPSSTCAPTPTPYPTPPALEILPGPLYQNPNGAKMAWLQYGGDPNNPKPGVLLIHGTNWNAGDAGQIIGEAQAIATAGFFAASVEYELAPNIDTAGGYIPGQPCHELDGTDAGWRMNLEVNDIKNYVKAMRADSRCLNGWVAVVGGSAGATHAITVALDTNQTPGGGWPHWMQNGDDRPNCAVMLSAIYDFSDWTGPTGLLGTDPDFVHFGMHNYAQVPNPIDRTTLKNLPLNPVNLVPTAITYGHWKPIYMINSYYDHPTAYHQLVTMICLLQRSGLTEGTDYQYLTIPGSFHSFHYWGSADHTGNQCNGHDCTVGDDVIAFLKAQAGLP